MSTGKQKMKRGDGGLSRGSAYERYKKTTRAFRDGLKKLVPSNMSLVTVSDLAKAAEHVWGLSKERNRSKNKTKQLKLLPSLLDNLKETIELRELVGATYAEDMDDGHRYMIEILEYCRQLLRISEDNLDEENSDGNGNDSDSKHNGGSRYGILGGEDDSDTEQESVGGDDDESHIRRPTPSKDKDYSIEKDLVIGSLAFQANLFFLTVENLFSIVADAYETLKRKMDESEKENHQTMVYLLQATATVNLVLKNVRYLEKSFFVESEHLETINELLAVMFFQDTVKDIERIVGVDSAEKRRMCLQIAGSCVEMGLYGHISDSDWNEGFESIVRNTVPKTREDGKSSLSRDQLDQLKEIGFHICVATDLEEYLAEVENNNWHWFKGYEKLGGQSGIMYTLSRLVKFMLALRKGEIEASSYDHWGPALPTTRHIMDTIFRNSILPCLCDLPGSALTTLYCRDTAPCICELLEFLVSPMHPCAFSTVFAIHSLLYGICVLQGDSRSKRLAVISKLAASKFHEQVEGAASSDFGSFVENVAYANPRMHGCLKEALDENSALHGCQTHSGSSLMGLWNPLFAGSFLLKTTFSLNMSMYCWKDACGQTTVVLHLYNALRQRSLIESIEFLELLDRVMGRKAWPNGKPKRDELLKSFGRATGEMRQVVKGFIDYIKDDNDVASFVDIGKRCLGEDLPAAHLVAAAHLHKILQLRITLGFPPLRKKVSNCDHLKVSSACRCIFESDFGGIERCDNDPKAALGETCDRQALYLQERIDEDHELLSLNWFQVGHLLENFVEKLFDDCLEISTLREDLFQVWFGKGLRKKKSSTIDNTRDLHSFGNLFLMVMVFSELQFQDNENQCVASKKVSEFMTEYFTTVATRQTATFF